MDFSDIPIVVVSFDRPKYLHQTLQSLLRQDRVDMRERRVYVFQDAAVSAYSGRTVGAADLIAECAEVYRSVMADQPGELFVSPHNLGVAANFHRAERFVFDELKAPVAYFFEDDLELSPNYIAMMDQMCGRCDEAEERSYFACYGKLNLSGAEQEKNRRKIGMLGHHWAFGLFREHWLAMQPLMQRFYDLTLGREYRDRDHKLILADYRRLGIPVGVTSQDDVKKAVTLHLNRTPLNTLACWGRYIGAEGMHMKPERFRQQGYHLTEVQQSYEADLRMPPPSEREEMRRRHVSNRVANILKQDPHFSLPGLQDEERAPGLVH